MRNYLSIGKSWLFSGVKFDFYPLNMLYTSVLGKLGKQTEINSFPVQELFYQVVLIL